ncbi:PglZ domain-containing protein, partial [bacterium]|nr:PglZ domain-containing protein [bacterium]
INNLMQNKLNVIVYNFVDMLSHARTEMEVIRELAENESAYRSITYSWFEHSPLFEIFKQLASKKVKIIITTDHGTVLVKEPTKILGDKNVNSNLRYKQGRALEYNYKEVSKFTTRCIFSRFNKQYGCIKSSKYAVYRCINY